MTISITIENITIKTFKSISDHFKKDNAQVIDYQEFQSFNEIVLEYQPINENIEIFMTVSKSFDDMWIFIKGMNDEDTIIEHLKFFPPEFAPELSKYLKLQLR